MAIQQCFSVVTNAVTTVNDRSLAVILSAVYQQQGKDKFCSTPQVIKSLSLNLFGFWQLFCSFITCSSVIANLHYEVDLENILLKKKQSTTRFVQIVMTTRNYKVP